MMRQAVIICAAAFFALTSAQVAFAAVEKSGLRPGGTRVVLEGETPTGEDRTGGDVVGASISHPARWSVEREDYTYDKTYGFTLWRPESGEAADDHGGTPALRVSRAYDLQPDQIEATVREKLSEYPDLSLTRQVVSVGKEGHEGVAIGPIPGSTPAMEVYVPVKDRVYRLHVYAEKPGEERLDAGDRELLSSVRFYPPSRSVSSLDVPRANAPRTLYRAADEEVIRQELASREAAQVEAGVEDGRTAGVVNAQASGTPTYEERRIYEGCYLAGSAFFVQTQHGALANKRWGKSYQGKTIIGRPNFWGQYTHGSLGYGRCDRRYYTNDKFAIDYPLGKGDSVYSPFKSGTVTFAGRNETHKDYGILVTIRAGNGKYVSLSGHLSGLAPGIKRGAKVTNDTLIGYAGATGGPNVPVGESHLHQAFYRYPSYNRDGSPFGGRGLQVVYFHYSGSSGSGGPGVYKFGWTHTRDQKSEGDWIGN